MKNWAIVLIILLGLNNRLISQNFLAKIDGENLHLNELVDLKMEHKEKIVVVTLVMINELDVGSYFLERVLETGQREKIKTIKIIAASISKPTRYEFTDSKLSSENAIYTLYRVTKSIKKVKKCEVVQKWKYQPNKDEVLTKSGLATN